MLQNPPNDLSRLEAMLTQSLAAQQQTQAIIKAQEEKLTQLMNHKKFMDTQLAQIASSNSARQQGSLPPSRKTTARVAECHHPSKWYEL